MCNKQYNGYANYETWAVSLWIDNDQYMHNQLEEFARKHESISELANIIEDWISDDMPELGASLWSDLLSAAFNEVDWYEIAELAHADYYQSEDESEE